MTIVYQPPTPPTPRAARRQILCGTEVPEECIRRAQVVIMTAETWHILAAAPYRAGFSREETTIPDDMLSCPIVNISELPEELDAQVAELIRNHYTPETGVVLLPELLSGLVKLGAKVMNRPCPDCEGTPQNCNDCQFLEEGSDTSTRGQLKESGYSDAGPM